MPTAKRIQPGSKAKPPVTHVYVDGFNLYMNVLKKNPHLKWLNLLELARRMLPGNDIRKVYYCTEAVKDIKGDGEAPRRQRLYWKALGSLPEVEIVKGFFINRRKTVVVDPPLELTTGKKLKFVKGSAFEEKGTDVNIATYMMADAFGGKCDTIAMIGNDRDLVKPLEFVRQRARKHVVVLSPSGSPAKMLRGVANACLSVTKSHLAKSQFPENVMVADGAVTRPTAWPAPLPPKGQPSQ
jgi:uncharacterized LabA/DUF88 family protein